ncbi:tRNA (guanosine(46)-N7)-methyltransferase TrmB [Saccharospirillum sp. MSK14-1]|uniref:tRNA (guanosine(46)-N7)-methyltransferase TrmB n=1 Tax=Saccharospirillum sp. MSK14-1 TaxID=1897632 RepID=UPI000D331D86|nr:tRNA (guanosine(46)-N7)-methyltransferase TrmB [Saccharospirillum sp. MSK14-1]PTY39060.1 tRNA (guanosine(46)-N7)-methyltransferase TrmB [Saccharospirillum sp. MSK14-1]
MTEERAPIQRKIRSFVMRTGRMTEGQKLALDSGWEDFGLEHKMGRLDLNQVFGNTAPVVFEIGFGNGDSLAEMARARPQANFIGVEVHTPGVGRLLHHVQQDNLSNIRVFREDAVEILHDCIADHSLDCVQLFFPDPWHKKRHHKRRIVQPEFAQLLRRKLIQGGTFHMATDWQNYAEHMLEVMDAAEGFENTAGVGNYQNGRPEHRPVTKFEQRGQRLGHGVWDLIYRTL